MISDPRPPTSEFPTSKVRAWLELVRVPNLPTVPGDPLAGFALASLGQGQVEWLRALPVVGASLLFYMAGMIWNDCADVGEDSVSRPDRPLPSGRIQLRSAAGVAVGMSVAGLALAASLGCLTFVVALLLLLLVLAYDFVSRRLRWLGILNMGACRGMSLLLGASAATSADLCFAVVISAAIGVSLYIVLVARIALNETQYAGLGRYVGLMIRFLIVIQAGLCLVQGRGGVVVAGLVLLGWPVSSWLGKRFYAS